MGTQCGAVDQEPGRPGNATTQIGWSFGPRLYRTSNGGHSWARQPVPGHGKQILDLAATATTTYAMVSPCACFAPPRSRRPRWAMEDVTLSAVGGIMRSPAR
jgi:hypothetical protein